MGNGESLWRKLHMKFQRRPDVRVLMIGLNGAGKTTILYKLKTGEFVSTIPTVGFNVETITFKGINFTTWDVSGRSRSLWRYYYPNTDVLILVVDSNDRERMEEVKIELGKLMAEDDLKDCSLLIMANKQDLPNAMGVHDVVKNLDLNKLQCSWYIQDCCATSGEGLLEGLVWLKGQVSESGGSTARSTSHCSGETEEQQSNETSREQGKERSRLQASWLSFSNFLTRTSNSGVNESYQRL